MLRKSRALCQDRRDAHHCSRAGRALEKRGLLEAALWYLERACSLERHAGYCDDARALSKRIAALASAPPASPAPALLDEREEVADFSEAAGADCAMSPLCERFEGCTTDSGRCIAAWSPDCEQSLTCKDLGNCTAREGRCVAASDADCIRSKACQSGGYCRVVSGRCVKHRDCTTSSDCNIEGLCTRSGSRCIAATDADCQQSKRCSVGYCTARNGACEATASAPR